MIFETTLIHNAASAPILIITFISLLILIAMNKIDKTILSLAAAAITLIVLNQLEEIPLENDLDPQRTLFSLFTTLIFGDSSNNFEGFQTLLLILGMMFIVQISMEGGVFQLLSFKLIQLTKGKPIYLLIVFSFLSTFITAVMNDILTVILLIPLTITICRILNIDPLPYIICQAIVIKMGASMLMISSIPNILVANYLNVDFLTFFLSFGFTAIWVFLFTLIIFYFLFRRKLDTPRRGIEILLEFDVWHFVPDKKLMYKSVLILIGVIFGFVFVPSSVMSAGMISFSGAIILFFISKVNFEDLMKKIDFKLLLYLIGIFTLSGGMEYVGIIEGIGNFVSNFAPGDPYSTFILTIWMSAGFSACIDNIPITRLLIPTIGTMTTGFSAEETMMVYSGLTYGVNWGDSLTPFGDTMLVINVTETNRVNFPIKAFFKVGFPTTLIQLWTVTIVYSIRFRWQIGIFMLVGTIFGGVFFNYLSKLIQKKKKKVFSMDSMVKPRKKILILEPDSKFAQHCECVINRIYNAETTIVRNNFDAFPLIRAGQYDLFLIEVDLFDQSVHSIINQVQGIKLGMSGGSIDEESRKRFDDFLLKPFVDDELLRVLTKFQFQNVSH